MLCSSPRSTSDISYDVMERFGLEDHWTLLFDKGRGCSVCPGKRFSTAFAGVHSCSMSWAISTTRRCSPPLQERVFLDIDPGFGQMWQALGQAELFGDHDDYVTIGENIG